MPQRGDFNSAFHPRLSLPSKPFCKCSLCIFNSCMKKHCEHSGCEFYQKFNWKMFAAQIWLRCLVKTFEHEMLCRFIFNPFFYFCHQQPYGPNWIFNQGPSFSSWEGHKPPLRKQKMFFHSHSLPVLVDVVKWDWNNMKIERGDAGEAIQQRSELLNWALW